MPRRSLLTLAERAGLLAFPTTDDEFIRHYPFSESDLSAIRQRRGNRNRIGFAVQLCYLRYPGFILPTDAEPPAHSLARAVFLNRLGEIRDRSFENQRYRASGFSLVVSAIVLWNAVYLEQALHAVRDSGRTWTTSSFRTCRRRAGSTST